MYLGDVEVFRTSTAEPTIDGIIWTYLKEMEQYNALWKEDQKVIFDLPNIVNSVYTGPLMTTLTATFFTVPDSPSTADQIIPISAGRANENAGSAFMVPDQDARVSVEIPRNVERAVVSLSACGQQAEEFWYTNVFSADEDTFADTSGSLSGYSPFREVQLLIDGRLAGVSWPFPIIFTGGIVPGFWRPIVGIDAFDLRQHEIDISPWLPQLCDGKSHTFEIRVAGLADGNTLSETVGGYWVVTGTIFLFLSSDKSSTTTGSPPTLVNPAPFISTSSVATTNSSGTNETLTYDTTVSRSLTISSTLITSAGTRPVTWTQQLTYTNHNRLTAFGQTQSTQQTTNGIDSAMLGATVGNYTNNYAYPLNVTSTFFISSAGDLTLNGSLTRGLTYDVFGPAIAPTSWTTTSTSTSKEEDKKKPDHKPYNAALLSTHQTGTAGFFRPGDPASGPAAYSFGTMEQEFNYQAFGLASVPLTAMAAATVDKDSLSRSGGAKAAGLVAYHRFVKAVNASVVIDQESIIGGGGDEGDVVVAGGKGSVASDTKPVGVEAGGALAEAVHGASGNGGVNVRVILGRGPGGWKEKDPSGVEAGEL